jgi:hypothetical protein
MNAGARKVIWLAILVTVLICVIANKAMRSSSNQPAGISHMNYNNTRICENAFTENYNYSTAHVDRFTVILKDGCFSGWFHIPSSWQNWHSGHTGSEAGSWIAYWFPNDSVGLGPYGGESDYTIQKNVHEPFRLQGRGTFTFYTNQPQPQVPTDTPSASPPLPTITRVRIETTDSHICEKPPEAYYAQTGSRFDAPNDPYGSYGTSPELLFDSNRFDGSITWANGFKGKVPVCFFVDPKGYPGNIQFPQPPGGDLEEHLKKIIMGWHFKGAYIRHFAPDLPIPVSCQLADMFIFE